MSEEILSNSLERELNEAQLAAVKNTEGPLIIFAGAGTGKTRVITYRIAHLLEGGASPYGILAVTFTNKAAQEMRKRVDELVPGKGRSVWISTFHSFGAHFLRVEAKNIGLAPDFLIYDSGDQKHIIKDCLKELNLDDKKFKPGRIVDVISRSKDELLDADSFAIHAQTGIDEFRQTCAQVYSLYQRKLKSAGALDFGDLLMQSVFALRDNPALLEKYQERFKYILVDEYQDTNHAQYLLTRYLSGKHKNICVVGDDDQSIYSWRGANIRNILEFEKDYPGCVTVKLERNYRSTPDILNSAWRVVKNNERRVDKKVWTEKAAGSPIKFYEAEDEISEAVWIASEVKRLVNDYAYNLRDFAVFYRINAQSRVLEDAFRREGMNYRVYGAVRFYERQEVKDIIAYLRLIHNTDDNISFKRIINIPRRHIGKTSIETLEIFANSQGISLWKSIEHLNNVEITPTAKRALLQFRSLVLELRALRQTLNVKELAALVLEKTGFIHELEAENTPEAKSRIENIYELISAIQEFIDRSPDQSLAGYLTQVSLVSDIDTMTDDNNAVTLMTLHLAKGLEFDAVFVSGLEEGLFPIGESAFEKDDLEEERRLMYVGMTRARKELYLSWAKERKVFGKSRWNMPSRFVEEAFDGNSDDIPLISGTYRKKKEVSQVLGNSDSEENSILPSFTKTKAVDSRFPLGSMVSHPQFGEGKVIEKSGSGDDLKLVVLFGYGQWKKLIAKYANLTQL